MMNIKNVNKKLLAGILGAVMVTTPLGLTACGGYVGNNDANATQDEIIFDYSFVENLEVIFIESEGKNQVYLVRKYAGMRLETYYTYHEIFSDVDLSWQTTDKCIVEEKPFGDYLIAYDYIQENYSKKELKQFFEQIKIDYYTNEKDNGKVK